MPIAKAYLIQAGTSEEAKAIVGSLTEINRSSPHMPLSYSILTTPGDTARPLLVFWRFEGSDDDVKATYGEAADLVSLKGGTEPLRVSDLINRKRLDIPFAVVTP